MGITARGISQAPKRVWVVTGPDEVIGVYTCQQRAWDAMRGEAERTGTPVNDLPMDVRVGDLEIPPAGLKASLMIIDGKEAT